VATPHSDEIRARTAARTGPSTYFLLQSQLLIDYVNFLAKRGNFFEDTGFPQLSLPKEQRYNVAPMMVAIDPAA
jgi:hypothetical protein